MPPTNTKSEPAIKPWQIGLFVLAAVIILWKVVGYIGEERAANNVTGKETHTASPNFIPGSPRAIKDAEK